MSELNQVDDFQDDGGTPQWRRRQEERNTIEHEARKRRRIFVWRFRDLTIGQYIYWFLIFPVLSVFLFYITALMLSYATGMDATSAIFLAGTPWAMVLAGRITTPNAKPRRKSTRYQ